MKKAIILSGILTALTSVSASAEIIIQPTLVEAAPAPVLAVSVPSVVVESPYPQHIEKHHHYDWRYWAERHRDQEREDR